MYFCEIKSYFIEELSLHPNVDSDQRDITLRRVINMAIRVVEFSNEAYKIRKIFA